MAIKNKQKEIDLIAKVLSDYGKTGRSEIKCPYCNTLISVKEKGSLSVIKCETDNCLETTIHGI